MTAAWRIGAGPWLSPQQVVDGVGWGYELERAEKRRAVTVIVHRHAIRDRASLPAATRLAIMTKGRSEARKAARLTQPPSIVVLGRHGYLRAPETLARGVAP